MKNFNRPFLLASLCAAAVCAAVILRPGRTQWDLRVYRECARTLARGGNPYTEEPVIDSSRFQCLYPPAVIDLYRPFSLMSSAAAERLWAALKIIALGLMLWLWRDSILRPGLELWRVGFIAVAYGSPFWADFRSGNASSFEHLILWAGLASFIAGKDFLFAVLIAASAQPKLLPLAFLPLVLIKPRPNTRALALGLFSAAALFAVNEWSHPGMLREFFAQLSDPSSAWRYERGPNNCSVLGLLQHVFETATGIRPLASLWAARVYSLWSVTVLAATGLSLARLWRGEGDETSKRRASVLLYAAAYALLVPRLKDYSFLLLLPPTIAALESDSPPALRLAIAAFALLNSTKGLAERAGLGAWALFAGYFKLYAAVLVWCVLQMRREGRKAL